MNDKGEFVIVATGVDLVSASSARGRNRDLSSIPINLSSLKYYSQIKIGIFYEIKYINLLFFSSNRVNHSYPQALFATVSLKFIHRKCCKSYIVKIIHIRKISRTFTNTVSKSLYLQIFLV